jgi:HEAT repeat protein
MKHKRTVILLMLAGILAIGTVVLVKHFSEPSFEGRTLTDWIQHGGYDDENRDLAGVLRVMGPKVIPFLLEDLFATDSKFKLLLAELESKQSIVELPFTWASQRRANAQIGLEALRGEPQLETLVPSILQRLKTAPDIQFRCDLIRALASIGPQAKEAIPFLLTSLKDTDGDIRLASAFALGNIGGNPERVVPALLATLHDPNHYVRNVTINMLARLGVAAKPAIPALLEVAGKDSDVNNRRTAVSALGEIDPAAAEEGEAAYITSLLAALKDPNARTRCGLLGSLLELKQKPVAVVKAALEALDDENERVRGMAASLLVSCGKPAQVALPKLRQMADNDPDEGTRQHSLEAIYQIEHPGEPEKPSTRYRQSPRPNP